MNSSKTRRTQALGGAGSACLMGPTLPRAPQDLTAGQSEMETKSTRHASGMSEPSQVPPRVYVRASPPRIVLCIQRSSGNFCLARTHGNDRRKKTRWWVMEAESMISAPRCSLLRSRHQEPYYVWPGPPTHSYLHLLPEQSGHCNPANSCPFWPF